MVCPAPDPLLYLLFFEVAFVDLFLNTSPDREPLGTREHTLQYSSNLELSQADHEEREIQMQFNKKTINVFLELSYSTGCWKMFGVGECEPLLAESRLKTMLTALPWIHWPPRYQ